MDPDANLEEQRAIVARMDEHDCSFPEKCRKCLDDGRRLGDLVRALDEWIANGGFLPAAWRNRARARRPSIFDKG